MGYLRRFLAVLFGALGLISALNVLIDPFSLFGSPRIAGINQVKVPSPGLERFFKPLQASVRQPQTVLIGTSRVLVGLDPRDVPGDQVYNLGVAGASAPELLALTGHVFADTQAKRIVLGLDYDSFLSPEESPAFRLAVLGRFAWWRALPDLLLSQHTLNMTRNTYTASRRRRTPLYTDSGFRQRPYSAAGETVKQRVLGVVSRFAGIYAAAPGSDAALAQFDTFLGGLPSDRAALSVFITPSHAALVETAMLVGKGSDYETWVRRLTEICAAHGLTLWDFGGYNRITTTPFASFDETFTDAAHFQPAVGRLIVDALFRGATVPDFGVRLTPEGIAAYLEEQRAARAQWHERQPDDVGLIDEAVKRACPNGC